MTNTDLMHDHEDVDATASPIARVLPHVTGLLICIGLAVVVGRPEGWIGAFAAVGPPVGAGLARLIDGRTPPWREAAAFGVVIAAMTAGGWALIWLAEDSGPLVLLWPVALLSLLMGVVNYVLVSISRSYRAARHQELDYPWIPPQLARILGLSDQGAS